MSIELSNSLDNLLPKKDFPDPEGPVITIVFTINSILHFFSLTINLNFI